MAFDIDLGVKDQGQDSEATRRQKDNITPEQYKITEADFFRGCPTILNSEVAALKVAEELYQICENGDWAWLDQDFGPKNAKDE